MDTILIVGLGNITDKYRLTRHNVGFLCLEYMYSLLHGLDSIKFKGIENLFSLDKGMQCYLYKTRLSELLNVLKTYNSHLSYLKYFRNKDNVNARLKDMINSINDCNVILAAPATFMNNSGMAIDKLTRFYNISEMIVIYDDLDTQFGTMQFRLKGGSGGHNGIKSINAYIKEEYMRVKVGIGASAFSNKEAFYSGFNDMDFSHIFDIYKKVFNSRLNNSAEFKNASFSKVLINEFIESNMPQSLPQDKDIESNLTPKQLELKQNIESFLKYNSSLHKTLNHDVANYVLSNFNENEFLLLDSMLKHISLSIACILLDKYALKKEAPLLDIFNMNQK